MKNFILTITIFLGLCSTSSALYIVSPGTEIDSGLETGTSDILAILLSDWGIDTEIYKDEVGGSESGTFADDYTTEYFNSTSEPSDALITWDGPDFITDGYLVVKDGNHDPAWYLFDISGWDGQEDLEIRNFWTGGGSISHVAIYEGGGTEVPEPATMLLFGAGLAGLASSRLRRNK